jgi:hypothetical protein
MVMLDTLLIFLIAALIVMPVVAILLMGLQRLSRRIWPPRVLAGAALAITLILVLAYFILS